MSSSPHLVSTSCCLCSGLILVRQPPPCLSGLSSQLLWVQSATAWKQRSPPVISPDQPSLTAELQAHGIKPALIQSEFAVCALVQGSENLKAFDQYMRDTTLKLNRKVEDLEDVRFLMGILKEVRACAVSVCAAAWPAVCARGHKQVPSCAAASPAAVWSLQFDQVQRSTCTLKWQPSRL